MMYLRGGDDIKLTLDAKEFDETIVYTGKGSKESNFLAQKALLDEKFEMELEGLLEKDEVIFKAVIDKKAKDKTIIVIIPANISINLFDFLLILDVKMLILI